MAGRPEDDGKMDARAGKRVMYILAGTAILWVLVNEIGSTYGWSPRLRGFFDLLALAGFALGLWMTYQLWRRRSGSDRNDKG